jgi:hypothetical protein
VNHERVELVERHARGVAGREGPRLVVGREHARAEAAEEPHHREVDLAVAAVDGGIAEAGRARFVAEEVAAPQVAVQARGRLLGADQLGERREEPLEPAPQA